MAKLAQGPRAWNLHRLPDQANPSIAFCRKNSDAARAVFCKLNAPQAWQLHRERQFGPSRQQNPHSAGSRVLPFALRSPRH
jgi:hypothetical protein